MKTNQTIAEMDIRDIDAGQVYYAIASKDNGGRCVLAGMFTAVWLDKKSAKVAAQGNPDYVVVKCLKGGA